MAFVVALLTLVMVLDCVALVLLVLIQLPKKDAGAGLAFGGGASDALFGAGSGNVLTKVTKYAAAIFFLLAIVLSLMQNHLGTRRTSAFQQKLSDTGNTPSTVLPPTRSGPAVSNAAPPAPPQAEQPVTTPPAAPTNTTSAPK